MAKRYCQYCETDYAGAPLNCPKCAGHGCSGCICAGACCNAKVEPKEISLTLRVQIKATMSSDHLDDLLEGMGLALTFSDPETGYLATHARLDDWEIAARECSGGDL